MAFFIDSNMINFGQVCLSLWKNTSITLHFSHFPEENVPKIIKAIHSDKHLDSKMIKQIKTTRPSLLMDEAFFF